MDTKGKNAMPNSRMSRQNRHHYSLRVFAILLCVILVLGQVTPFFAYGLEEAYTLGSDAELLEAEQQVPNEEKDPEGFFINDIQFQPNYSWIDSNGIMVVNATFQGDANHIYKLKKDTAIYNAIYNITPDTEIEFFVTIDPVENASINDTPSRPLAIMQLHLMANGQELDLEGYSVQIELLLDIDHLLEDTTPVSNPNTIEGPTWDGMPEPKQEEEIMTGVSIVTEDRTIESITGEEEFGVIETFFEMDSGNSGFMLMGLFDSANPTFNIQHYVWFTRIKKSSATSNVKGTIEFADTSAGLYGSTPNYTTTPGGDLVTNNDTANALKNEGRLFYVDLDQGTKGGKPVTEKDLVRLFADERTNYIADPQINYMNRLYNSTSDYNTNYTLSQVWVYQPMLGLDGNISADDPYVAQDGSLINGDIPKDKFVVYRVPVDNMGELDDNGADPSSTEKHLPERIRFTNNRTNPHLTIPFADYEAIVSDPDGSGSAWLNRGTGNNNGLIMVRNSIGNNNLASYPYFYTILIQKGTVVRFVFNGTEAETDRPANFFDYNIGDGNIYTSAANARNRSNALSSSNATFSSSTKYYMYTEQQGINNPANYTGTGAKIAFGNANCLTGLDSQSWDGYDLNKYNRGGVGPYKGATFGLVKGVSYNNDDMPIVQWADGVNGANWFGKNAAVGKFVYPASDENYKLGFYRQGGTFTLNSVKHGSAVVQDDLMSFINTANSIMSNEFWPMDDVGSTDGHDFLFGSTKSSKSKSSGTRLLTSASTYTVAPIADGTYNGGGSSGAVDGAQYDHNSFFGMSYTVDFTIDPGYVAPLEYWFYGDDDLWVFLDQPNNPNFNPILIADIGGIHSSIGEYVNLWDYVPYVPLTASQSETYRLTIFYTERGASGSTCYMRFTVPTDSITMVNRVYDEAIVVEKRALDIESQLIDTNEPPLNPNRIIFQGYGSNEWPADVQNLEQEIKDGKLVVNDGYYIFRVRMWNANGIPYRDMYDYAIYDRSQVPNHQIDTDKTLCVAWGTVGELSTSDGIYYFALKSDEYIVISNLPDGTYYGVQELLSSEHVTGWQKGTHSHPIGGGQEDRLDNLTIYTPTEGERMRFLATETNYVRFINSSVLKTEEAPGDGKTLQIGDTVDYNIHWAIDWNNSSEVITRDRLDPGVDFVGAKFGDADSIFAEWWEPSKAEIDVINETGTGYLEYTWTRDDGATDTARYYPAYVFDPSTENVVPELVASLMEQYGTPAPTVVWIRHANIATVTEAAEHAAVALRVRVTERALQPEDEPGKFENSVPRIENRGGVQINNDNFALTDLIENPVWEPQKNEIKIDHTANADDYDPAIDDNPNMEEANGGLFGPNVAPGDVITYRITWRNADFIPCSIIIRDVLDKNVEYVVGSANAYRYTTKDNTGAALTTGPIEKLVDIDFTQSTNSDGTANLRWELTRQDPLAEGYVEFQIIVKDSAISVGQIENQATVQIGENSTLHTEKIRNEIGVNQPMLPLTGGPGLVRMIVIGCVCVVAAVGIVIWNKKRDSKDADKDEGE